MMDTKDLAKVVFDGIGSDNLDYIEEKMKEIYKEIENIITADDYFTYVDLSAVDNN